MNSFPIHDGMLTNFNLYREMQAGSCNKFISTTALSHPEDTGSPCLPSISGYFNITTTSTGASCMLGICICMGGCCRHDVCCCAFHWHLFSTLWLIVSFCFKNFHFIIKLLWWNLKVSPMSRVGDVNLLCTLLVYHFRTVI